MFDIRTIVTSLIVSIVVVFGAGLVGGNQSENLGAVTRMPNVDLISKSLSASTTSTTATSTVSVMGAAPTQGGILIIKDSDGSGCTQIWGRNGSTSTGVATCP